MDLLSTAEVKDPDGNAVDITMGYGKTGNIVNNSRLGAYTYYSSRPNAVRAAGANTYDYDANGNMKTRITGARSQSMVFDHENRLASITEGANRNDYLYDYTGARVKKVSLVSGVTSTTVYIGGIYEQKDGVNLKHIFAGGRRVASRKGSSTFYFHPDHLGSLSVVTNASGESKQTATYYPFGETRNSTGPEDFDYKFTGQENDPETGLYYYGARYYDPEIGRFISPDSIVQAPGDPQTLNRYSYCRNNPLMYTDPTGHFWQIIVGAIIGAIMSGIQSDWNPGAMFFGAVVGGISGGAFMGAESAVSGALTGVIQNSVTAGAISGGAGGMAAGVVSGGLNALYYKGDLGEGIWKGAAFGAASGAAFGALKGLSAGPASNANGLSDNSAANASVPDKMPIPTDVRTDLAGFFSDPTPEGGIDYSNVTLQKGVPFFPRLFGATAYTSGNNIYWDPKTYLYPSIPFTAMVGHELIHVGQYAHYSVFQLRYFFANIMDGGYLSNRFEVPAFAMQKQIEGGISWALRVSP
ncbi:MAG: RHS repeat-associated core domain-containing protein [Syntrophobacteraceae bacterium]